jgi:hypothetical protein
MIKKHKDFIFKVIVVTVAALILMWFAEIGFFKPSYQATF